MKKLLFALFIMGVTLPSFAQIDTPPQSPAATVSQGLGLTNVTISYSRPAVNGRPIFGSLVPYGKVWRTGANKITTISFDDAIKINGAEVKAGTYGLYTIPGQSEWTIILNRDATQWGAYNYNKNMDVISFKVQPFQLDHMVEYFTIEFTDFTPTTANVQLSWDDVAVQFPIEQDVNQQIMAQIKTATAQPNVSAETLYTSADYYYQNNYDLPQAFIWSQRALEKEKEYWSYQLVARIAAKMGNCAVAVPNAKTSMQLAQKAGDDAYVILNQQVFAVCGQ